MNAGSLNAWYQFVAGDISCFEKLFKSYYKGMYGYGLKLCNDPSLVEDSIQDLFESIWERRRELTHITSPNVYLYVSLRRNILNTSSKQNRVKEKMKNTLEDTPIHFGADELIIRDESKKQQRVELHDALNQLSNRQKEILYLYFYNGMTYGEIEEILSINRQSVRNHMYKAMETLRTLLDTAVMRLAVMLILLF